MYVSLSTMIWLLLLCLAIPYITKALNELADSLVKPAGFLWTTLCWLLSPLIWLKDKTFGGTFLEAITYTMAIFVVVFTTGMFLTH